MKYIDDFFSLKVVAFVLQIFHGSFARKITGVWNLLYMSHSQSDDCLSRSGGLCTWKWRAGKLYCQIEQSCLILSSQTPRSPESTGLSMLPGEAELEKQRNTFFWVEAPGYGIHGICELTWRKQNYLLFAFSGLGFSFWHNVFGLKISWLCCSSLLWSLFLKHWSNMVLFLNLVSPLDPKAFPSTSGEMI